MPDAVLLIVGIVGGIVLAAVAGVSIMRSKMVVSKASAHAFDETCDRVEKVVGEAEGWSFPNDSFDMGAPRKAPGSAHSRTTGSSILVRLFSSGDPARAARSTVNSNNNPTLFLLAMIISHILIEQIPAVDIRLDGFKPFCAHHPR